MTVSSQICKRIYQADGENRQWAIDFPYLSGAELKVYVTNEAGLETEVTSQCVLDEIEQEIIYPTLASAQDPLPSGNTLTILRVTTPTQTLHLTQQGTLDAAALEKGFDKLTLQVQELAEQTKRSIKYPVSSAKTEVDAQIFLADLHHTQAAALSTALAEVTDVKSSLEQTVADEETARIAADQALQSAINEKQNALSAAQQQAVNSNITAARVASYDTHLLQTNNPHAVTKEQLGLGNVDNTADLAKPISYATQEALERIDDELEQTRPWQKPADWVDIRSGALNNSIYVLVGHAADFSQYAKFSFIANTSTSGNTYDVYVDGIKQTTTASGTATTLDWQTLALDSGYDVTYPAALRTHIVRITPTQSTDTFTRYRIYAISGQRDQGLLWLHFELSNPIQIASLCATDTSVRNFLLQAVTAKNDNITYTVNSNSVNSGFYGAFRSCTSLKKIPVLTAESTQYASGTYISFVDVPLKKVIIKNNSGREELRLINSAKIQEFDIENGVILSSTSSGITDAHGAVNLKKLPPINASDAATFQAHGLTSLQDTFVDDSSNSSRKLFRFYGTGAEPVRGLKGLVVSNEAPFDGESPQINVAYTGLDRQALRQLFKSMPTVSANQVCNITGAMGAADLTAEDLAIATDKGWTVTR